MFLVQNIVEPIVQNQHNNGYSEYISDTVQSLKSFTGIFFVRVVGGGFAT